MGYEVLLVSQFTLHGRLNGNKLDFSKAMRPNEVWILIAHEDHNPAEHHGRTNFILQLS